MKLRSLQIFMMLACMQTLHAQVIYEFNFDQVRASKVIPTKVFLQLNANNEGIMRMRYRDEANKLVLTQSEVSEQIPFDAADSSRKPDSLLLKISNTNVIAGADDLHPDPLLLSCYYHSQDSLLTPSRLSFTINEAQQTVIISDEQLITDSLLTKNFVLTYFSPTENFYRNIFDPPPKALTYLEKDTRLILLAVGNTTDAAIGIACAKDIARTVSQFRSIADFMGIKFEPQTITGVAYNKLSVQYAISKLTPRPKDIVVFYYSGHGFRKPKDSRRYPYIDLRPKEDDTYMINSMNLADIYSQVNKKGARLNIVIGDCCNSLVEETNAEGANVQPNQSKGFGDRLSLENCRTLFLAPQRQSLLIASADAGQKATSNPFLGSFFSYYFTNTLNDALSPFNKGMTWQSILENAQRLTKYRADRTYCDLPKIPENICSQLPYYIVF